MDTAMILYWSMAFAVVKLVICITGILFNGLVILTIWKNIHRVMPSSYFILSIAFSDFLTCALALPLAIARQFGKQWPFGMAGCQAHAFMVFLLASVSLTHLAAISMGKYWTIARSFTRNFYFNKKKVLLVILATWIYSIALSVPPLLGWSRYGPEEANASCSIQWESSLPSDQAYFGVIFVACYFVPICVITCCYYKIHRVSKRFACQTSKMGGLTLSIKRALMKKHRKSAMYFLAVTATFLFAWTPFAVVSFLSIIGMKIHPVAVSAPALFAKTSFCLNPILYAIISSKFRRRMVEAVACIIPRHNRKPNRVCSVMAL